MDGSQFDARVQSLVGSRRSVMSGALAIAAAGLGVSLVEAKKKKREHKKRKRRGGRGQTPGNICRTALCLSAPLTIEAFGSQPVDDITYLFVPPQDATTGPAPYIEYACDQADHPCGQKYPFACVDPVLVGAGSEVTTISRLLPGKYEYWIQVPSETPAGGLSVILSGSDGREVRQWTSPPAPVAIYPFGWHVFDIDGANGRVIDVDEAIAFTNALPKDAHDPHTYVCPTNT